MKLFPGALLDIEYYLPEKILKNDYFQKTYPEWNVDQTATKTGVMERRIAAENETAYDLAVKAVKQLLAKHPSLLEKVDSIIFCTQTPDYIMPSNAFLIQKDLGFKNAAVVFDYNLACSGYVYGLALASNFIKTKMARNVLLVTADTYSKLLKPDDRATQMLFGDGATASWVSGDENLDVKPLISSFEDFHFSTEANGWDKFIVKSGGFRQPLTRKDDTDFNDKIFMNGIQVVNFVNHHVVKHMSDFMKTHDLNVENIDQFFVHQASLLAIESIAKKLKINDEKIFTNIQNVGNTVSSSLPILIKDYFSQKNLTTGSKLFICGFGVGFSTGSIIATH